MPNKTMRLAAFLVVAAALLYSGVSFHEGRPIPTILFMSAAVALTVVTRITVRKKLI
jgi:hypothetical protein